MPPHPPHSHDDSSPWSRLDAPRPTLSHRQTTNPSSSSDNNSDFSITLPTGAYIGMALGIVLTIVTVIWCVRQALRGKPPPFTRPYHLPSHIPLNKMPNPPPRTPREETLDPPPAYATTSVPIQAMEPVHMAVGPDFVRQDKKYGGSAEWASAARP